MRFEENFWRMDDFDYPQGGNPHARFAFAFVVDDEDDEPFDPSPNGLVPRYIGLMKQARDWCEQNIDSPDDWTYDRDVIYLAKERDAFAFKLRWS